MTLALFLPEWLTAINFLIGVFMFLVFIGGVVVVLLLRKGEGLSSLQVDRANAAEALVKTRDAQMAAKDIRLAELEEELEAITAEHRILVAIDIAKLVEFWGEKEVIEAQVRDLQRELRIERRRKDGE